MTTDILHPLVLALDPTDLDLPADAGSRLPGSGRPWGHPGFLDLDRWERSVVGDWTESESRQALVVRLRQAARAREAVSIGTLADPYGGRRAQRTRRVLEACRGLEGLALSLTTRSPWVERDLPLLAEIDGYHAISIDVPITAADPVIARRLEPEAAEPAERLGAIAALAAHGISTAVWCLPIVAGENDREEVLAPLFAAAREAGARDVLGAPLFRRERRPPALRRLAREIPREIPGLAGICRYVDRRREAELASPGDRRRDPKLEAEAEARKLGSLFRRLRLEHGFPADRPSRG